MPANSASDLQHNLTAIQKSMELHGMEINTKKTETMSCLAKGNTILQQSPTFNINGQPLPKTTSFNYLGSNIDHSGKITNEIRRRIALASTAFSSKAKLFENRRIPLKLKIKLFNCYVTPVLLYACETWPTTGPDIQRLQAFQNSCFRKMLGIRYPKIISNADLWTKLAKLDVTPISVSILDIILHWTGHVLIMPASRVPQQTVFSNLHNIHRNKGRVVHRVVFAQANTL